MNHSPYIVRLRSLTVTMAVGVNDWEKLQKQRVSIEVELYGADPGATTDLGNCIDYSRVHAYVMKHWPDKPHTELLETLGDELASFCLSLPLVAGCRVKLGKPDVFEDGSIPEIELYREK
ncbi:MAG: dihydroneopterin aldolase [Rhodospirillales bacterium]|nr:dihydroneopterin aldolase [Rhodospirillales bacterium]